MALPAKFDAPLGDVVTVVSGLPRSGTSMMMQMLNAGGHPMYYDDDRVADDHNPRGYLESRNTRRIRSDARWLAEAKGRAVKVVAPLLRHLDTAHLYSVVFMERPIEEVMTSQRRMLGEPAHSAEPSDGGLAEAFGKSLDAAHAMVAESRNIRSLRVDYHEVLNAPGEVAARVADFVGRPLDVDAMAAVVDPSLYRSK